MNSKSWTNAFPTLFVVNMNTPFFSCVEDLTGKGEGSFRKGVESPWPGWGYISWYLDPSKAEGGTQHQFSACIQQVIVLVSCGCHNILPQICWLKTTKMYSLIVWRPEVQHWFQEAIIKVLAGLSPTGGPGEERSLSLPASGCCRHSSAVLSTPVCASSVHCLLFCLCDLPLPLPYRDICD